MNILNYINEFLKNAHIDEEIDEGGQVSFSVSDSFIVDIEHNIKSNYIFISTAIDKCPPPSGASFAFLYRLLVANGYDNMTNNAWISIDPISEYITYSIKYKNIDSDNFSVLEIIEQFQESIPTIHHEIVNINKTQNREKNQTADTNFAILTNKA